MTLQENKAVNLALAAPEISGSVLEETLLKTNHALVMYDEKYITGEIREKSGTVVSYKHPLEEKK